MNFGSPIKIQFGGVTDLEGAKLVARNLFNRYDKNQNGVLDTHEVAPMMVDAYKSMNKGFNPSDSDLDTYSKILDKNNDGRITYEDIEQLAIKYLVGNFQQQQQQMQVTSQVVKNARSPHKQEQAKRAYHRQYTNPVVVKRLEVAERLFQQFDIDGSGFLEEDEVLQILIATYREMGQSQNFTNEDVKAWIKMGDVNMDGKISYEEYEAVVIRSLEKQGIKIE